MTSSKRSIDNITPAIGPDSLQDLRILEAIQENPNISQRLLAEQLGTALGVVNACIHALARKGLVKIRGENNRSLTYHLTKRGVLHKSRLALEWTRNTINYYRDSRIKIAKALGRIEILGLKKVALVGDDDLIELVGIIAGELKIEVKCSLTITDLVNYDRSYTGVDDLKPKEIKPGTSARSPLGTTPKTDIELLTIRDLDAVLLCTALSASDVKKIKTLVNENVKIVELF